LSDAPNIDFPITILLRRYKQQASKPKRKIAVRHLLRGIRNVRLCCRIRFI